MIDYKTLDRDKNGIPPQKSYLGPILKVANKTKDDFTKADLIEMVKKEVPLPSDLSALKTKGGKGKNTIEDSHIARAIGMLLFSEGIEHTDRKHYKISICGSRAYKKYGIHLLNWDVFYEKFEMEREQWEKFKEDNYDTNTVFLTDEGYISFRKSDWKKVQTNNHKLSFDEYLDAQKASESLSFKNDDKLVKLYFTNNEKGNFNGVIAKVTKKYILLGNLSFDNSNTDVFWMKRDGLEDCRIGDQISFTANIYPYLQISKDLRKEYQKQIYYALAEPSQIGKIRHLKHYKLPKYSMSPEYAWKASSFSATTPYSEIENELEMKEYTIKVDYQVTGNSRISAKDVFKNAVNLKHINDYPQFNFEQEKLVPKTQVYSVYDAKDNKLLFKTKNYAKLRQFVESLYY